jgi:hypothetical protein
MRKTQKRTKRGVMVDRNNFQEVVVIPRSLGWAPRRLRCSLRYSVSGIINNAGIIYANHRYVPTYVYDVDPTLGNTAVPGLAEYGGIWRLYRVRSASITVSFSNKEIFPVTCYICPVNTDPGANTANYANYLSNRLSKQRAVGPLTGNGVCVLKDSQTTSAFAGVPDLQQLDTYCGSTNGGTAPTNNWWYLVGIYTDGTVMSAGVDINAHLDMDVEFFELLSPAA